MDDIPISKLPLVNPTNPKIKGNFGNYTTTRLYLTKY